MRHRCASSMVAGWLAVACTGAGLPGERVGAPVPSAAPAAVLAPGPREAPPAADPVAELRAGAGRLLAALAESPAPHARLAELTDGIGHRLSGSASLEAAVRWAERGALADGHLHVRLLPVKVPHWVRGAEAGAVVTPAWHRLHLLGLGGTVGTGPKPLRAEVVVVTSFDELDARAAEAKGRIVLFDVPLPPANGDETGYGAVVQYRSRGASRAAQHGAVAALVRSVTARSLRTPHTGALRYDDGVPRIPAAAVSVEDAALLARLARGPVRPVVELSLGARTLPDATSHDVIVDLPGRELPDEIVLVGAHLDSWDVGQGAHDNGAGVVMVLETLRAMRRAGLRPRRTVRGVLFTNEENGLMGARAYAEDAGSTVHRHVAALEADSGAFEPRGFRFEGSASALPRLRQLATLLEPLGATRVEPGHAGADLTPLVARGVPALGLWMDASTYFDFHHSEADTLDKVDPRSLASATAALAVMTWAHAETPDTLPRGVPAAPARPAPTGGAR